MSSYNGVDFLCGKVTDIRYYPSGKVKICTRDDEIILDPSQDDAFGKIVSGRRRMIVARDGVVLGIFGRPRIRLLHMILRGGLITEEVIWCSQPMFPQYSIKRSISRRNGRLW